MPAQLSRFSFALCQGTACTQQVSWCAGQGYVWMAHRDPESPLWALASRSKHLWQCLVESDPAWRDAIEWQVVTVIIYLTCPCPCTSPTFLEVEPTQSCRHSRHRAPGDQTAAERYHAPGPKSVIGLGSAHTGHARPSGQAHGFWTVTVSGQPVASFRSCHLRRCWPPEL